MNARTGLFAAVIGLAMVATSVAREEKVETAVYAKIFNRYVRTPSVLGGYQPETFAFADGGALLGRTRDRSVDDATFDQVIHLISPALTHQNYIAATDPEDTDLLIYVTWGKTDGYEPAMVVSGSDFYQTVDYNGAWDNSVARMDDANRLRDRVAGSYAGLLGYREAMRTHRDVRNIGVHGTLYEDLAADVEEPRYFVILTAFDFRTAWKERKLVPLWSTRYNIAALGNHFTTALPAMSQFASRYFGRDSQGLIRRLNPTGTVEMDELKILGPVETPAR